MEDMDSQINSLMSKFTVIDNYIGECEYKLAISTLKDLLQSTVNTSVKDPLCYLDLYYIACYLIDCGGDAGDVESIDLADSILSGEHHEKIIDVVGKELMFYSQANALSLKLGYENAGKANFNNIEPRIRLKKLHWKSYCANKVDVELPRLQTLVNLAIELKTQFRFTEALEWVNQVLIFSEYIPEAYIARSEIIKDLSFASNHLSERMLLDIKDGYQRALNIPNIREGLKSVAENGLDWTLNQLEEFDDADSTSEDADKHQTEHEFSQLSDYRKFCIFSNLTLSEHALYCQCAGSSKDDLTVCATIGLYGDRVIPMEFVVNRIKSEFSFARNLYFECVTLQDKPKLAEELFLLELGNNEYLGLEAEKLRTIYRLCFGILDKIAVAISNFFEIPKITTGKKKRAVKVDFLNVWNLDLDNRREFFNEFKNPGLVALYSISSDLNDRKQGEWDSLKAVRNALEHNFLVIREGESDIDSYGIYDYFAEDIKIIDEQEFISGLKILLSLTRSAIFSFTYAVRYQLTYGEDYSGSKVYPLLNYLHQKET
ncbi:hypothetical protein L2750_12830 [Shewanella submarina]|uniref:LA2681 family HEPN domain-containing protein n=1 Tax=Shewanella submarina TaxID=2016376 RepID=A0ABV7GDN8_9GAMM|nr:LA2681 family HEPN domain-containing protein [Shewanella submarina]MCL1038034.1 hypothetical protein [Shewanella submarina]